MTPPIRIWTCADYHPAFRCGGWAGVRLSDGQLAGWAGGERYTSPGRMALAGLAAGLRDLPARKPVGPAEPVLILTTSAELAGFAPLLASLGAGAPADGPAEDLDLWAQVCRAALGRRLTLTRRPLEPRTALAFASAWADLARDKAKASGPFTAPIPRSNLAKMPGPDQD